MNILSRPRLPRFRAGFTLLELLVVVVIIGLLVGYVAPRYFGQVGKSEVTTAKAQIDALEKALDQFRLDTGHYPSTELGLGALVNRPQNEPKWNGPYLRKDVPLDPWGKAYTYKQPGERGDYDIMSFGKDGQPGGTGENADISNH
jgi:general secretion pathway protein G